MHDVMVIINDLGLKGYDKLYIDEYIKQYSKLNGKEIIEDIVNEEVPEVDEDNNEEEMNKNNIIEADNNINIDRIVYNVINDNTGEVEYTTFILEEAINKCNINSHVYDTDMNIIYPKDAKIDTIIVEEDNKNTDINYSNSIVSYSSIPDIITNDSINEEDIYPIYVKNINVYKNPHDTRPFRCITGNYYIQGEEVNKRTLLTKKPNDTSIKSIIGWVKSSKL